MQVIFSLHTSKQSTDKKPYISNLVRTYDLVSRCGASVSQRPHICSICPNRNPHTRFLIHDLSLDL